jgi:hypothetical protein
MLPSLMWCGAPIRDNDVDYLGDALGASLRPAILDRDGSTLKPTEFLKSLREGGRHDM